MTDYTLTIGGTAVPGTMMFDVVNPATGEVAAQVPDCSAEQLDEAVSAARAAFPRWAATPIDERRRAVIAIADAIEANIEELKRILTIEQGKSHEMAVAELAAAAGWCRGTATFDLPVVVFEQGARRGETRRVPIGVVGAIAAWNFPVLLAILKIAPAILAGNTVVLKPSPFTPLTTLRIGELLRGGIPEGVLNVISGGDALGPLVSAHPGIDKITFTGSTQTGRKVFASAAATLKRVTLELGGNDAAIVFPDVDIAAVAEQVFWAAFLNSGQICVATKRLYVHRDIYEPFAAALIDVARTVRMGNGAEQGVQLGPVQNRPQYERVLDLIADSKANGHNFLLGGEPLDTPGYFIPVTVIGQPPEDSRIMQEEQFGPVLPMQVFDDVDEVIARANATEYGLGATIWADDVDKAAEIGARLTVGNVWINNCHYLTPFGGFGGRKQSGLGVEGSQEGLLEFTDAQTFFISKPKLQTA